MAETVFTFGVVPKTPGVAPNSADISEVLAFHGIPAFGAKLISCEPDGDRFKVVIESADPIEDITHKLHPGHEHRQ